MLVHLAEAGDGAEIGLVKARRDLARKCARRPDPGDAAALDHDLPILAPAPRMDIEQPADAQRLVGGPFPERDQREVLADADLLGGVDEIVDRRSLAGGIHGGALGREGRFSRAPIWLVKPAGNSATRTGVEKEICGSRTC